MLQEVLERPVSVIPLIAMICIRERDVSLRTGRRVLLTHQKQMLFVRSKGDTLFFPPGMPYREGMDERAALFKMAEEDLGVSIQYDSMHFLQCLKGQAAEKPDGVLAELRCFALCLLGEPTPRGMFEECAWITSRDPHPTSETGRMAQYWFGV